MKILGLDISSTSTGYCLPDGGAGYCAPKHPDSFERVRQMRDFVVGDILDFGTPVDFVMKEAIGTSMVWTAISIAKGHALIEDELVRRGIPFAEIAPNTLKKFATGNGLSTKSQMSVAAAKLGYDGDGQEDAMDAWWVRQVGLALHGIWEVPETDYRLDILTELRKSPEDKKNEKKIAKQAKADAAAARAVKAAERERIRAEKAAAKVAA